VAGLNPCEQKDEYSRKVGLLFAEDSLYIRQSARANLRPYAQLYGINKYHIDEVLAQVGLADHTEVRVEKLPTSLARRLALGRAILHQPEVLILVEPFNRCDGITISWLSKQVQDFASAGGTVLILANDTNHLTSLCDMICRLEQGRIIEAINPTEAQPSDLPFKIPVRMEGKVILINPTDILYAMAEEGSTFIQLVKTAYPSQSH
jgi:ABC-2 type transport system ATP-binding protein